MIKLNGYTLSDLEMMSRYIELEAPLIIHIKLKELIKGLNKDCRYRNLFETKTGGGCIDVNKRMKWEEFLF
jgi:hypothetical protein